MLEIRQIKVKLDFPSVRPVRPVQESYIEIPACTLQRGSVIHDLIIRDAKIVDGTGADAYSGDIAIDGSTLTQVGGSAGPGPRI